MSLGAGWVGVIMIVAFVVVFAILNIAEKGSLD